MKILLVAQHAEPTDGWGTLARTTALGLVERGHEVTLLLQKPSPSLPVPQRTGLPSPLLLLSSPFLLPLAAWRIWRAIRATKPDLVHVLTEPYALPLACLPKRSRHPWVMTACGTYAILPFSMRPWSGLWKRVCADTRYVLAISEYTRRRMLAEAEALGSVLGPKTGVYTLGIEWPATMPPRRTHPEKRLLFVGGVKPRKGVREIVEACGKLRPLLPGPFRLDVVGTLPENDYTRALRARVRELELEDSVVFRGQVSAAELLQAYADADLFVMLSIEEGKHFEGYGLVFLEANAFGVPVIGPNGSGCTDAIADGRSGFLVDPHDTRAVAAAMQSILAGGAVDPEECRRWAREHSIARQAEETEAIYAAVLG